MSLIVYIQYNINMFTSYFHIATSVLIIRLSSIIQICVHRRNDQWLQCLGNRSRNSHCFTSNGDRRPSRMTIYLYTNLHNRQTFGHICAVLNALDDGPTTYAPVSDMGFALRTERRSVDCSALVIDSCWPDALLVYTSSSKQSRSRHDRSDHQGATV